MVSLHKIRIIIITILAAFVSTACGITCYNCVTKNGRECAESSLIDCITLDPSKKYYGCSKVSIRQPDGNEEILRECVDQPFTNNDEECFKFSMMYPKIEACDICMEDGCNSASITGPITVLTISLYFLVDSLLH